MVILYPIKKENLLEELEELFTTLKKPKNLIAENINCDLYIEPKKYEMIIGLINDSNQSANLETDKPDLKYVSKNPNQNDDYEIKHYEDYKLLIDTKKNIYDFISKPPDNNYPKEFKQINLKEKTFKKIKKEEPEYAKLLNKLEFMVMGKKT